MSEELAKAQRDHWQSTYQAHPVMYGEQPSQPARYAAALYLDRGARTVAELGAGHGRDTLHFARHGLHVHASDFSATGLVQLTEAATDQHLADQVTTTVHDARDPLPWPAASLDGAFAHMLLCMALSTRQIRKLTDEIRRVLRPDAAFVYTVRHTGDAHYGAGIAHGDNIYEHGGFAVHYFDRALVDELATGWHLNDVHSFTEGDLPRRLWRVTMTKPEPAQRP